MRIPKNVLKTVIFLLQAVFVENIGLHFQTGLYFDTIFLPDFT